MDEHATASTSSHRAGTAQHDTTDNNAPQAKPAGGGGKLGAGGGDLPLLRDGVQRLCQVATPLARTVEFLRDDAEGMAKEFRWVGGWVGEAVGG